MIFKGVEGLTQKQQEEICEIIGDWYLMWKHSLVNYQDKTHYLGFAKEKLKEIICGTPRDEDKENA